jgi:hypothetical protein
MGGPLDRLDPPIMPVMGGQDALFLPLYRLMEWAYSEVGKQSASRWRGGIPERCSDAPTLPHYRCPRTRRLRMQRHRHGDHVISGDRIDRRFPQKFGIYVNGVDNPRHDHRWSVVIDDW